jgi:hypothetical protein
MFNLEKVNINLAFPLFYFVIGLLLIAAYTFYIYRYTIPQVSTIKKMILVTVRALGLLCLLFAFFEPVLSLARKKNIQPINLVFLDNSRSMQINDGTNREATIRNFVSDLRENELLSSTKLFTFGSKVSSISFDSLQKLNFSEGSTNFSKIFLGITNAGKNISSIVLVSDGVITEGSDPLHTAEKLNIPIYTIGIGDTATRNDVIVKNVLHNDLIYAQTPTNILATISNIGFANKNASVSLYENNILVSQKNIILNPDGIQNVEFDYTPKTNGEKKLAVTVSNLPGEFTFANNKKIFYINVLSNKVKVLILAGSPSSDLAFIKNTLKSDNNLTVNSITQITNDKFIEKDNPKKLLDSANVLFLVGFPSKETPNNLLQQVIQKISEKNIPYFITLSNGIDFNKIKLIQNELPFSVNGINSGNLAIQPDVSTEQMDNPLLDNNASNPIIAWNNLPPVYQPDVNLAAKPESQVIARIKVNNVLLNKPLILTRILGEQKSVAVLAKDIWRWKLETVPQNLDLFDRFILSSVKWLNSKDDHKQVIIKTSKKIYSLGETVEFSAQAYDQSYNPVSNAKVFVKINHNNNNYDVLLNPLGSGLYEGTFQNNQPGDYSFDGVASLNGAKLGEDKGNFNIGEIDVEMLNPQMNYQYLTLLASQTGGMFFFNSNYKNLFEILKQKENTSSKEKIEVSEINLWSNEWLLLFAILLFGTEWFLRKRNGML